MKLAGITRRDTGLALLALGTAPIWSAPAIGAAPVETPPVDTSGGKVRGRRASGVSAFLAIPYGEGTRARRFQPPGSAVAWTGIRDCFEYGPSAPQGAGGAAPGGAKPDPQASRNYATFFLGDSAASMPPVSENCLVLNVWTPDASVARKRPVMFYLHGGGFSRGSGSPAMFDGAALAGRGDVVVITINHRLGALGYLYLGALASDFADSGNVGQLDQILALRWVQDNIGAFGGDRENVTIFGQSGGGAKVSTLLAMPSAQGLFHKAIIQSGAGLRMVDKDEAAAHAERTLAALGVDKKDVRRLQEIDAATLIAAASGAQKAGTRSLAPVVDGRSLPRHPFDPDAPPTARTIPIIVGTTKDEATLTALLDPDFGKMTVDQVRQRFSVALHERADAALEMYRKRRPKDEPTYWYTSMATDSGTWINSIRLAERKAHQQPGAVYMYRLDWETPVLKGVLRSPHALDVPLVFDNAEKARSMVGPGDTPVRLGAQMSQAIVNFARAGNPSQPGLEWPSYDATTRKTVIFDAQNRIVSDPDGEVRRFFSAV